MRIHDISLTSSVDGEGLRTVVWFQGCPHQCAGCHNYRTWDKEQGIETTPETACTELNAWKERNKLNGIKLTLSGGEPFDQAEDALKLIRGLENLESVWIYTGYTIEELLKRRCSHTDALLEAADILVDGKYEQDNMPTQAFVGSGNQRILDLKACNNLSSLDLSYFEDENNGMVVRNRFLLPEGYVHSSKTRSSDTCPNCNRVATDDDPFERIRRITGYLVGTVERFNQGKKAEEKDRTKHA
jgi:anaerobic ribonucleoside-triphosphate reductase activating protein